MHSTLTGNMRLWSIPRKCPVGAIAMQRHRVSVKVMVSGTNGSATESLKTLPYAPVGGKESAKCVGAMVKIDNSGEDSVLSIEVPDYPGLLRVISWVINGMELRVKSASLRTSDDGLASNVLHLTDLSNSKLSEKRCEAVVERLEDFVMYCSPSPKTQDPKTLTNKFAKVCHESHSKYTVLTVFEGDNVRHGFLLDVASMLSGVGVNVVEAEIGTDPTGEDPTKRVFSFLVADESGDKLSASTSSTVLYVMSLMFGDGNAPTVVPSEAVGVPI